MEDIKTLGFSEMSDNDLRKVDGGGILRLVIGGIIVLITLILGSEKAY